MANTISVQLSMNINPEIRPIELEKELLLWPRNTFAGDSFHAHKEIHDSSTRLNSNNINMRLLSI